MGKNRENNYITMNIVELAVSALLSENIVAGADDIDIFEFMYDGTNLNATSQSLNLS